MSEKQRRQLFSTLGDHKIIHPETSSQNQGHLETSVHKKWMLNVGEGSQKHSKCKNGNPYLNGQKSSQSCVHLCEEETDGRTTRLEQALPGTFMNCSSAEDLYLPKRDSSSDSGDHVLVQRPKRILKKKFRRRSSLVSKSTSSSNVQPLQVMNKPSEETQQRTQDQPERTSSLVDQRLRDLCELQSVMATDLRGLRTEMANIGLILGKMLVLLEKYMNADKTDEM